ncbi:MAG TPA: hypothetical protein VF556_07710 [Pyrinomonadaceae bacterium]|jgi:hypothetical protein
MSLIKARQKPGYRWHPGDLTGTTEAAQILGYKSPKVLQDDDRRKVLMKEFESLKCTLTDTIWIGGQRRFLRSEIDEFLTRKVESADAAAGKRREDLRLVK